MKIKWIGSLDELNLPKINIPKNAVCVSLDHESEEKLFVKSLPFIFISILNACLFYFIKYLVKGKGEVNINYIWALLISSVLVVIFLPVHEYLHAIIYPKSAVIYMGFLRETGGMFISSQSPIKKRRYIVMSIFPFCILSLFPFIVYCFISLDKIFFNNLLFWFAFMTSLSTTGDFYNIYQTIKKIPKKAIMQVSDNKMYYFIK